MTNESFVSFCNMPREGVEIFTAAGFELNRLTKISFYLKLDDIRQTIAFWFNVHEHCLIKSSLSG